MQDKRFHSYRGIFQMLLNYMQSMPSNQFECRHLLVKLKSSLTFKVMDQILAKSMGSLRYNLMGKFVDNLSPNNMDHYLVNLNPANSHHLRRHHHRRRRLQQVDYVLRLLRLEHRLCRRCHHLLHP